jgi:hypothetical protein
MKYIIAILFFLGTILNAQTITLLSTDVTAFPLVKGRIITTDKNGLVEEPNIPSINLKENGQERKIIRMNCQPIIEPDPLSLQIMIDRTSTMNNFTFGNLTQYEVAVGMAREIVRRICPAYDIQCSIATFNNDVRQEIDFTRNTSDLIRVTNTLNKADEGKDITNSQIVEWGIQRLQNQSINRVLLIITDGSMSNYNAVTKLVNMARANNVRICWLVINGAGSELNELSLATKGTVYEQLVTTEISENYARAMLYFAQKFVPCEIQWTGQTECTSVRTQLEMTYKKSYYLSTLYTADNAAKSTIQIQPEILRFRCAQPGEKPAIPVSLNALGTDFIITDIVCNDPDFEIFPRKFNLDRNAPKTFNVYCKSKDTIAKNATIEIKTNLCSRFINISSLYDSCKNIRPWVVINGEPSVDSAFRIVYPNGGEFIQQTDSLRFNYRDLKNTGVLRVEISPDSGKTWTYLFQKDLNPNYPVPEILRPLPFINSRTTLLRGIYMARLDDSLLFRDNLNFYIDGGGVGVVGTDMSPNGDTVLSVLKLAGYERKYNTILYNPGRRTLKVYDTTECVPQVLSFSPSRRHFAQAHLACNPNIIIREVSTGKKITSIPGNAPRNFIYWSPDGSKIAWIERDLDLRGQLLVADAFTGKIVHRSSYKAGPFDTEFLGCGLRDLAWSPDSKRIATLIYECNDTLRYGYKQFLPGKTLAIYSLEQDKFTSFVKLNARFIFNVRWIRSRDEIILSNSDSTIGVYDPSSLTLKRNLVLEHLNKQVLAVFLTQDEKSGIAVTNRNIRLFNLDNGAYTNDVYLPDNTGGYSLDTARLEGTFNVIMSNDTNYISCALPYATKFYTLGKYRTISIDTSDKTFSLLYPVYQLKNNVDIKITFTKTNFSPKVKIPDFYTVKDFDSIVGMPPTSFSLVNLKDGLLADNIPLSFNATNYFEAIRKDSSADLDILFNMTKPFVFNRPYTITVGYYIYRYPFRNYYYYSSSARTLNVYSYGNIQVDTDFGNQLDGNKFLGSFAVNVRKNVRVPLFIPNAANSFWNNEQNITYRIKAYEYDARNYKLINTFMDTVVFKKTDTLFVNYPVQPLDTGISSVRFDITVLKSSGKVLDTIAMLLYTYKGVDKLVGVEQNNEQSKNPESTFIRQIQSNNPALQLFQFDQPKYSIESVYLADINGKKIPIQSELSDSDKTIIPINSMGINTGFYTMFIHTYAGEVFTHPVFILH